MPGVRSIAATMVSTSAAPLRISPNFALASDSRRRNSRNFRRHRRDGENNPRNFRQHRRGDDNNPRNYPPGHRRQPVGAEVAGKRELLTAGEHQQMREWMRVRNMVVHSQENVSRAKATEIVHGVLAIEQRLGLNA